MDNAKLDELERVARSRPLDYETTLALITAARRPDGWVMVPREPTHGMVVIGAVAGNTDDLSPTDDEIRTIYRAMLSAAPKKEPDHG